MGKRYQTIRRVGRLSGRQIQSCNYHTTHLKDRNPRREIDPNKINYDGAIELGRVITKPTGELKIEVYDFDGKRIR